MDQPVIDTIEKTFQISRENAINLSTLFNEEVYEKGTSFLEYQKKCKKMSFIAEGYFRVYRPTAAKDITQWIAMPGYFLTDLESFMNQTQARWEIEALTDAKVYTLSLSDYQHITEIIPTWPAVEKQFLVHCFITMEERIFGFLSQTAEERFHYFFNAHPELFNQVPLQHIASMLGMTPETLSRLRKQMIS